MNIKNLKNIDFLQVLYLLLTALTTLQLIVFIVIFMHPELRNMLNLNPNLKQNQDILLLILTAMSSIWLLTVLFSFVGFMKKITYSHLPLIATEVEFEKFENFNREIRIPGEI